MFQGNNNKTLKQNQPLWSQDIVDFKDEKVIQFRRRDNITNIKKTF